MSRKLNEHIVAILASTVNSRVGDEGILKDFELKGSDIILGQRDFLETTNDFRQVLPVVTSAPRQEMKLVYMIRFLWL